MLIDQYGFGICDGKWAEGQTELFRSRGIDEHTCNTIQRYMAIMSKMPGNRAAAAGVIVLVATLTDGRSLIMASVPETAGPRFGLLTKCVVLPVDGLGAIDRPVEIATRLHHVLPWMDPSSPFELSCLTSATGPVGPAPQEMLNNAAVRQVVAEVLCDRARGGALAAVGRVSDSLIATAPQVADVVFAGLPPRDRCRGFLTLFPVPVPDGGELPRRIEDLRQDLSLFDFTLVHEKDLDVVETAKRQAAQGGSSPVAASNPAFLQSLLETELAGPGAGHLLNELHHLETALAEVPAGTWERRCLALAADCSNVVEVIRILRAHSEASGHLEDILDVEMLRRTARMNDARGESDNLARVLADLVSRQMDRCPPLWLRLWEYCFACPGGSPLREQAVRAIAGLKLHRNGGPSPMATTSQTGAGK